MDMKINVSRIDEFLEKVRVLNKRIKKMHGIIDDVKVTFGARSTTVVNAPSLFDPDEIVEFEIEVVAVTVESSFIGQDIKVNGWTLMAVADYSGHQSEAEFKIVSPISKALRTRLAPRKAQVCDHCNRRVFRNKMIVVKSEAGEEKAVGNSCVADFLGWGTPETILSMALLKGIGPDLDAEFGGVRFTLDDVVEDLVDYLCVAKYIIDDNDGWALGRNTEKGEPTSEWMSQAYGTNPKARYRAHEITAKHVNDTDLRVVQAAINWSKTQAAEGNEFHQELGLYIRDGYVGRPHRSNAFWIVGSYMNMKKSQEARRPVLNEYYGAVKDKFELDLTLTFWTYYDGQWGRTYIYKFTDEAGRLFVSKTANALGQPVDRDETGQYRWRDAEAGDVYCVKAKVMEHSEYNEIKETRFGYAKYTMLKANLTAEEAALEPQKDA
uniref:Uncharacterized protein n=1 Tax=Pseudomonas phage Cygsa01 TaxID=3138529 RepID=A0AAU6W3S0_9VIRU